MLRFAYLFVALSLATYIPLVNKYDVWIFLALLERTAIAREPLTAPR